MTDITEVLARESDAEIFIIVTQADWRKVCRAMGRAGKLGVVERVKTWPLEIEREFGDRESDAANAAL